MNKVLEVKYKRGGEDHRLFPNLVRRNHLKVYTIFDLLSSSSMGLLQPISSQTLRVFSNVSSLWLGAIVAVIFPRNPIHIKKCSAYANTSLRVPVYSVLCCKVHLPPLLPPSRPVSGSQAGRHFSSKQCTCCIFLVLFFLKKTKNQRKTNPNDC